MITKARAENFQGYKDQEFIFSGGINIITGKSNVGKSSVIRMFDWVAENRPLGDDYRRHGTKKTVATVDDVSKIRTATKNEYHLNGEVYKAIRSGVPTEITNHLNLSWVNFQGQHDPLFLIANIQEYTPGKIAKILNNVADLQVIDDSRELVKHNIRAAKASAAFQEEELTKQKGKVDGLLWVRELDKDYRVVEELQKKADSINTDALQHALAKYKEYKTLADSIPDVKPDKDQIKQFAARRNIDIDFYRDVEIIKDNENKYPDIKPDISKIQKSIKEINNIDHESLLEKIEKLRANQIEFPDIEEDINVLQNTVSSLDETHLSHLAEMVSAIQLSRKTLDKYPDVDSLEGVREFIFHLKEKNEKIKATRELVDECMIAEDCRDHATTEYDNYKHNFDEWKLELGECPFCGGEINENSISG